MNYNRKHEFIELSIVAVSSFVVQISTAAEWLAVEYRIVK